MKAFLCFPTLHVNVVVCVQTLEATAAGGLMIASCTVIRHSFADSADIYLRSCVCVCVCGCVEGEGDDTNTYTTIHITPCSHSARPLIILPIC